MHGYLSTWLHDRRILRMEEYSKKSSKNIDETFLDENKCFEAIKIPVSLHAQKASAV